MQLFRRLLGIKLSTGPAWDTLTSHLTSLDLCGPLCTSVDLLWASVDLCGPLRTSSGPLWTSVDLCGPPRTGRLRGLKTQKFPNPDLKRQRIIFFSPPWLPAWGSHFCQMPQLILTFCSPSNQFWISLSGAQTSRSSILEPRCRKPDFGRPPWLPSPGASFCLDVSRKTQISCSGSFSFQSNVATSGFSRVAPWSPDLAALAGNAPSRYCLQARF